MIFEKQESDTEESNKNRLIDCIKSFRERFVMPDQDFENFFKIWLEKVCLLGGISMDHSFFAL